MGTHERLGKTDEWYTPPEVFHALNTRFSMDVASPGGSVTPWIPADSFVTSDGLTHEWRGRVWMNPPFGRRNGYVPWARKFAAHRNGIALAPDRTSAPWFQAFARQCDAILFWSPKIHFIGVNGVRGMSPSTGTALLAIGPDNVRALKRLHGVNGLFCTVGE